MPGYTPDIKAGRGRRRSSCSRKRGDSNLKISLWNRAVDQPYKILGTWHVDQWRKVGINADQKVLPSGPCYAGLARPKDVDVAVTPNGQTIVNPTIDISKYTSQGRATTTRTATNKKSDELYYAMLYETDPKKQYEKMRAYEKFVLLDGVE